MLIGTMFSNFIGNKYNFLSEIPLILYFILQYHEPSIVRQLLCIMILYMFIERCAQ